MVCGERQRFLSVILTLKYVADSQGKITDKLDPDALNQIKSLGVQGNTYEELLKDQNFT